MALLGSIQLVQKANSSLLVILATNNAGFFCNIHPKLNMYECTVLLQNQFGYTNGLSGVLTPEVA